MGQFQQVNSNYNNTNSGHFSANYGRRSPPIGCNLNSVLWRKGAALGHKREAKFGSKLAAGQLKWAAASVCRGGEPLQLGLAGGGGATWGQAEPVEWRGAPIEIGSLSLALARRCWRHFRGWRRSIANISGLKLNSRRLNGDC